MSRTLIVVDHPDRWPLDPVRGVEITSSRDYLTNPELINARGVKVFNLCRSYAYQSLGYYVSLLAEARGHRPQPSIATIQGMKSPVITRILSDDIEELAQESLSRIRSKRFVLSVYFGRTLAKRYKRLGRMIHSLFPTPFSRANFVRDDEEGWELRNIRPIPAEEIPESHHEFALDAAQHYFAKPWRAARKKEPRFDLAILWDEEEKETPSDERAIERFVRAAEKLEIDCDIITKEDYSRVGEYDALFIRQTTAVNHHTYRFSRRAEAEGLVVIDDPASIVRCTNKVYLAELLASQEIAAPRTVIVRQDNVDVVARELGFPCILKMPDSSFSQGVVKVESADKLEAEIERCLEHSDLLIAQEFLPTEYDWRVGIIDKKPLFVAKYHMARHHWQIVKRASGGRVHYGGVEAVRLEDAPPVVVRTALKAANSIGDGFYGVDLKVARRKCYVIEVNDNPNVDAGCEDRGIERELYARIMQVFLDRMERLKQGATRGRRARNIAAV